MTLALMPITARGTDKEYCHSLIFGGLPRADWEWNALEDEAEYRFNLYQQLIIGE